MAKVIFDGYYSILLGCVGQEKVCFSELSVNTSKEKLTDILLTLLLVKFIIIISVMNQSIVI